MKILSPVILGLLSLGFLSMPARSNTIVGTGTITIGSSLPGSSSDFIFFNANDYLSYNTTPSVPGGRSINHSIQATNVYSNLTSFTVQGGLAGEGPNGYATITSPLAQSLVTGDLAGSPGAAFALTPGAQAVQGTGAFILNPTFNYNNFNVYLMVSNTGGFHTDVQVSIDPRNASQNPAFGTNDVTITPMDNSATTSTTAEFVEFNVQGLGTTLATDPGADLVVSANLPTPNGQAGYIGAVSFESIAVPEPSIYAMMGLGLLALVSIRRFRRFSA